MKSRHITGFWFTTFVVRPACAGADFARWFAEQRIARRAALQNRRNAGLTL